MVIYLFNALVTCLRPLLGPPGCCRFELPCTQFAHMELSDKSFFKALWSIAKRIMICNPLF